VGVPIIDITAGMFSSTAILAALRVRDATGQGQRVDLSLLGTQVALLTNVASNYLVGGLEHQRLGNAHPSITPYEAFPASDRWFALAAANERQWAALCHAIERPDLAGDPRFKDNNSRVNHRAELRELLVGVFQRESAQHWIAQFRRAGLPCAPIHEIPEVFSHPQAHSQGLTLQAEHTTAGTVKFPGFPYVFSETPAQVRLAPPRLGQHTDQILREVLAYSAEDIAGLRAAGTV
jgi:crotonobetainyl-CoA:carnitine CoA-transferase CaiB-like acyl-CoA transferase